MSANDLTNSFARACFEFRKTEDDDLELKIGDVVYITKQVDKNWCRGNSLNANRHGIFPSSFITKLNLPKLQAGQKLYLARDRFIGEQSGDLSFLEGDLLVGLRRVDDNWWEGEAGGRRGIFPVTLVTELKPPSHVSVPSTTLQPTSAKNEIRAIVKQDLVPVDSQELELHVGETVIIDEYVDKFTCRGRTVDGRRGLFGKGFVEIITTDQQLSSATIGRRPESVAKNNLESIKPYGRTKYKFDSEYPDELPFSAGIIVELIQHVDDEWTEGMLNGRRGIFPTSYVDIVVDCPKLSPALSPASSSGMPKNNLEVKRRQVLDSGYSSSASDHGSLHKSDQREVTVQFDFMGAADGDLTAFKGDRIVILQKINHDWLKARHGVTGQIGVIPLSFVEPLQMAVEKLPKAEQKRLSSSDLDDYIRRNVDNLNSMSISNESPRQARVSMPVIPSHYGDLGQNLKRKDSKRESPPARPAVPASLKMRQTASEHLEIQRQQAKELKKMEMRQQRTKIFQEVIKTEREYAKDLTIFRDTVLSKRNMLDADCLLGGSVWSNLIETSKRLLTNLEKEADKDFVYQEVGSAFLTLADEFTRVYGLFCESHEEAQILLERYDTEPDKQIVLKELLKSLQQQTTCIDLSTMLSRPVHRILKYPLFLGELLKYTEDNQSDKVKLLMALKVTTEVAQAINESKRRKDLVTKYRKDNDVTLSERLSRFTLHSVRKKSARLSMRLSSTIGLTQLAKDGQFDDAERQFRAIDRCCRSLLRDVQAYCEQLVIFYNYQLTLADAVHSGVFAENVGKKKTSTVGQKSSDTSTVSGAFLESWTRILLSEAILQRFFDSVNEKVRLPVTQVQHFCKGPQKLISKRGDKLLDYESVLAKLEKTDTGAGAGRSMDSAKTSLLEEELRKARVEYEAMNSQLLTELPQFNRLASDALTMAICALVSAQRSFVYEIGRCFERTASLASSSLSEMKTHSLATIMERFAQKQSNVQDWNFFATGAQQATVGRRPDDQQINGSSNAATKTRSGTAFPQKLQAEAERVLLRTIYDERRLFTVSEAYDGRSDLELSLKRGDLVGVIVDKDPMGSSERWFVDNGINKGFVPGTTLTPISSTAASYERQPTTALIDLKDAMEQRKSVAVAIKKSEEDVAATRPPPSMTASRAATCATVTRRGMPLMMGQVTEQRPTKPTLHRSTTIEQRSEPIRPKTPVPRPSSVIGDRYGGGSCLTTAQTVDQAVVDEPPPPPALHPIRPAPAPPLPSHEERRVLDERTNQLEEREEKAEFYVVLYDFSANSENELNLVEGQVLLVHAKQDLEANSDWWLAENEDGEIGYAPGNYLAPYSASRS